MGCPRARYLILAKISEAAAPVVDLLLRLVLGVAVLGLELAFQLLTVAVDLRNLVVRELSPTAPSLCP